MQFKHLSAKLTKIIGQLKSLKAYSLVPKKALQAVLKNGLYSSQAISQRPDLMKLSIHPDETVESWKKKIEEDLKDDFRQPSMLGPSAFFHLPPTSVKLSKKHPTNLYDLALVEIDLGQLLKDMPDTKVFGMELEPFDAKNPDKIRHRYINDDELEKYVEMSPEENWKDYRDMQDRGLYAPNVPHASIHTKNGIIPPKYLRRK